MFSAVSDCWVFYFPSNVFSQHFSFKLKIQQTIFCVDFHAETV